MDGNLLDPETADETLAKDWNLPELPEGVRVIIAQVVLCKMHAILNKAHHKAPQTIYDHAPPYREHYLHIEMHSL